MFAPCVSPEVAIQTTPMEETRNIPELAVLRSSREPRTGHLTILRELNREEYGKYQESRRLVTHFVDEYLKFTMTRRSYNEYVRLLRAYDQEFSVERPLDEIKAMAIKQEVNRRLRGFLTEMRSFLDHAETSLKHEYGKEAKEVTGFLKARSRIFDSSPSYRLVNKLRDYALHRNLAIQNMTYTSKLNKETEGPQSRLSFHLDKDELLQTNFTWTKHVRPYLEKLPARFKLDPHIQIAMYLLEQVNVALVAARLPKTKEAARYINELAESVREPGTPCVVFNAPGRASEESEVQHIKPVIDEIPTYIAALIEKLPESDELLKLPGLQIDFVFKDDAQSG
jgi:hypothetical protein